MDLVEARTLSPGQFFRKRTGVYPYVTMNPASLRFFKVPEDTLVFGVSIVSGTLTQVQPNTLVVPLSIEEAFQTVRKDEADLAAAGLRRFEVQ